MNPGTHLFSLLRENAASGWSRQAHAVSTENQFLKSLTSGESDNIGIILPLYPPDNTINSTTSQPLAGNSTTPVDIGSQLELMLDDYLIDYMDNLTFQLHAPQRAEKVLVKEFPWETEGINHVTVFPDDGLYRMYYRGYTAGSSADKDQVVCYAESRDGIQWDKPELGLFEWKGSSANNIVWWGGQMAPFIDTLPGVPPEERYKALAENPGFPLVSPDGIRWRKLVDQPIIPPREGGSAATRRLFPLIPWGLATVNKQDNIYMAYLRARPDGFRRMA